MTTGDSATYGPWPSDSEPLRCGESVVRPVPEMKPWPFQFPSDPGPLMTSKEAERLTPTRSSTFTITIASPESEIRVKVQAANLAEALEKVRGWIR